MVCVCVCVFKKTLEASGVQQWLPRMSPFPCLLSATFQSYEKLFTKLII